MKETNMDKKQGSKSKSKNKTSITKSFIVAAGILLPIGGIAMLFMTNAAEEKTEVTIHIEPTPMIIRQPDPILEQRRKDYTELKEIMETTLKPRLNLCSYYARYCDEITLHNGRRVRIEENSASKRLIETFDRLQYNPEQSQFENSIPWRDTEPLMLYNSMG